VHPKLLAGEEVETEATVAEYRGAHRAWGQDAPFGCAGDLTPRIVIWPTVEMCPVPKEEICNPGWIRNDQKTLKPTSRLLV
jgi:hypothetical protein